MHIRIFSSQQNTAGLKHDAALVEQVLRYHQLRASSNQRGRRPSPWNIEHCDPTTWGQGQLTPADIHIYLEIPSRLAVSWARFNAVVVNPEWWPQTAWNWSFAEMDLFVFKSAAAAALFPEVTGDRSIVVPWKSAMEEDFGKWSTKEPCVFYAVGGSPNKVTAARPVIDAWSPAWPPLEIWCGAEVAAGLRTDKTNIVFQTEYRSTEAREARQRACKWHCVASVAEGFGYTMAEAVACGAPVLWCDLPVQRETWALTSGCIAVRPAATNNGQRDQGVSVTADAVRAAAPALFALGEADVAALQGQYRERRRRLATEFRAGWERVLTEARRRSRATAALPVAPPKGAVPPKVAILTVTRNRAEWWPNMIQNVTQQSWPVSRLEWVIVDDSDADKRLGDRVAELRTRTPALTIHYVPLDAGETIGAKRNRAVAAASADVDVFVCMDDDDHYPANSLANRVSWLPPTRVGSEIAYCSVLPMYDIRRYISAINVPPLRDEPADRVSEATLAFTRAAWTTRPFPEVSMGEGHAFVAGRESQTVEMPPAGVIVSFLHKGNTSSRRIPADQEPNGSHYGFSDPYFRFLHTVGA
jgi:hypothetical protein